MSLDKHNSTNDENTPIVDSIFLNSQFYIFEHTIEERIESFSRKNADVEWERISPLYIIIKRVVWIVPQL